EALGRQPVLRRVIADVPAAKEALRQLTNHPPSVEEVLADMVAGYLPSAADHAALFRVVPPDPRGDGFVDRLARIDPGHPEIDALYEAFLTQQFTARKTLLKK